MVRAQCWGCASFADSLIAVQDLFAQPSSMNSSTSDKSAESESSGGFCVHTMMLDQVWQLLENNYDCDSQFSEFVKNQFKHNKQVTRVSVYGDTIKWLVIVPPETADSHNANEFAVCRSIIYSDEVEFFCESMKCVRDKHNKDNRNAVNISSMCVHLNALLLNEDMQQYVS